jgi:hypothetical protein
MAAVEPPASSPIHRVGDCDPLLLLLVLLPSLEVCAGRCGDEGSSSAAAPVGSSGRARPSFDMRHRFSRSSRGCAATAVVVEVCRSASSPGSLLSPRGELDDGDGVTSAAAATGLPGACHPSLSDAPPSAPLKRGVDTCRADPCSADGDAAADRLSRRLPALDPSGDVATRAVVPAGARSAPPWPALSCGGGLERTTGTGSAVSRRLPLSADDARGNAVGRGPKSPVPSSPRRLSTCFVSHAVRTSAAAPELLSPAPPRDLGGERAGACPGADISSASLKSRDALPALAAPLCAAAARSQCRRLTSIRCMCVVARIRATKVELVSRDAARARKEGRVRKRLTFAKTRTTHTRQQPQRY